MNKLFSKIAALVAGLSLVIGVGFASANNNRIANRVEAAIDPNTEAVAFALAAKCNNSDADSSTEITTGPNNLFTNGSTYLSAASSSKVYLGASSAAALKFGSSSKKGTMTLTLKSGDYAPTKVIFSIAAANDVSKKVNLSLNSKTSGTGYQQITTGGTAKNFADYEVAWDGETALSSIKVEAVNASNNRFYLKSISVVVSTIVTYDVSFNSLGGGSFDTREINEGDAVGELPIPAKPKDEANQKRYTFLGWFALSNTDNPANPTFEGATEYTASTPVTSDVTLYAKYQEISYYKVVFNSNGGSEVTTQEIDAGQKASEPAAPTKAPDSNYSYSFVGWYKEAGLTNAYDFNDAVNENTTLYAKWNQSELPAKDAVANVNTIGYLSYSNYEKSENTVTDTLNRALTGVANGSTSYTPWNNKTSLSGIKYAGSSAGSNNSIQLRSNDDSSGIVVTSNTTGLTAKSITVKWNNNTQNGRVLNIYGKDSAYAESDDLYDANKDGDLITGLAINDATSYQLSYNFTANYQFIGIRSDSGAQYIESITIEWNTLSFTYENLSIRFGGRIEADLWTRLNTESSIQGYGVLLSTYEYLNAQVEKDLKNYFESADGINVKKFTNADTYPDHELKAEPTLKDGYRVWNLYKQVRLEDATKDYVGVAFIQINGEVVFLNSLRTSVKKLAQELIAGPDRDENSLGGSLNYLANL